MAMLDSFNLVHDHVLTATANGSNGVFGVLHNDSTDTLNPLSVSKVNGNTAAVGQPITLPSSAALTMQADGSFVYTPVANSAYMESFVYTADDGVSTADAP